MRKWLIVGLLLTCRAWASISFQTGTGTPHTTNTTAGASCVITYTPHAAGDAIIFALTVATTTITSASVSDNATSGSSPYTMSLQANSSTDATYLFVTTAVRSGATSFTASWTTNSTNSCALAEYSGVLGIGTTISATGSSSPMSVSLTTIKANSWVVMVGGVKSTATYSAGTGCSPTATCTLETSVAGTATTTGAAISDDGNVTSAGTSVTVQTILSAGSAWAGIAIELTSVANWSLVNQQNASSGGTGVTSESAPAFKNALTNTSTIIAVCQALTPWSNSGATTTYAVPTDTAGNTYIDVQVGTTGFNGSAVTEEVFYALNTHTTASNVVTCHSNAGSITFFSIVAFEVTGGATAGPIDTKFYNSLQTSGGAGANAVALGSQSQWPPTVNDDLIVAACGLSGGPGSPGNSPNVFMQLSGQGGEVEMFVQPTAAAIAPSCGDGTATDTWGAIWFALTPSGTASKSTTQFRNDVSATANGTSLGNKWTLVQAQQVTSDSLATLTSQMQLLTNPTVGNLLICQNGTFPQAGKVTCADSLGNVASGKVTQTAPHTITFSSGIPFSMANCGVTPCDWNGKTIVVNGTSLTINTVTSFTSLTVTNTITTNAVPVTYTGPTPSCTDSVSGPQGIQMTACFMFVQSTGSDTVTVTTNGVSNFDVVTSVAEIAYAGGSVLGLDTAACPVANCQAVNTTSNSSTGVISQTLTLTNAGELVIIVGDAVNGPFGNTAGWTGLVIGSTAGTSSNTYCTGTNPFCLNGVNGSAKSSATSGSFTSSMTDATHSDASIVMSIPLIGQSHALCTITVMGAGPC